MPKKILIASYPKSGNTWLKFILVNLVTGAKNDFRSVIENCPDINSEEEIKAYVPPKGNVRFFKSHSNFPLPFFDGTIYVYRHVCDVLVSFYFHVKKFYNDQRTIEEFFIQNEYGKAWGEAMYKWNVGGRNFAHKDPENFMAINYDLLLEDTFLYVDRINTRYSLGYSEKQMRDAISLASFHSMQEIEQTNGLQVESDRNINFVREGKAGNYLNYISPELAQKTIEMNKHILNSPLF